MRPRLWLEVGGLEDGYSILSVMPEAMTGGPARLEPLPSGSGLTLGEGEAAYAVDWLIGRLKLIPPGRPMTETFHPGLTEVARPINLRSAAPPLVVSRPDGDDAAAFALLRKFRLQAFIGFDPEPGPLGQSAIATLQRAAVDFRDTVYRDEILLGLYRAFRRDERPEGALESLRQLRVGRTADAVKAYAFLEEARLLHELQRWEDLKSLLDRAESVAWGDYPAWDRDLNHIRSLFR